MSNDKTKNPKQDSPAPDAKNGWVFIPNLDNELPYDALPSDDTVTAPEPQAAWPDISSLKFDLRTTPTDWDRRLAGRMSLIATEFASADHNRDGKVTHKEARSNIGVQILTSGQLLAERDANTPVNIFSTPTYNMEGKQEQYIEAPVSTTVVIADRPLIDRALWEQSRTHLTKFDGLQGMVKDLELPKNVHKIRLSDMCKGETMLPCQTLPDGRILIESEQKSPTT